MSQRTGSLDKPERLIFIPFIFGFGGVERLVIALSRYLANLQIPHSVVCFEDTIGLSSYADWQLNVRTIAAGRSVPSEANALRKSSLFSDSKCGRVLAFDLKGAMYSQFIRRECVVHLTDPPSLLPTDITRDAFSAAPTLIGAVSRLSHPLHSARAELAHQATRRGVRKAETVIVMTDAIARELHRIYGVDCRIVRPGVDTTIPRSKKTRHDGAFRLISISRLESTKRLDWVLRALAALESSPRPLSQLRDWRFDIVGDGSQRAELESLSTSLGLRSRVSFHGWLDDRAVQTVNNEADLFVMPAAQGYGLPALESLVRRIPVIIHRDSGVSEIFDRNPWVRIVSAPDGTDLGSAIREMSEAISRGEISDYPVPMIPSETDWAAEISRICGWIETG